MKNRTLVQNQAREQLPDGGPGVYSYRKRTPSGPQRDKVRHALVSNRQLLFRSAESIRILVNERDEAIAQSLEDGLPVPMVAAVTELAAPKVVSIGVLYDSRPSAAASAEHLRRLRSLRSELRRAEKERASLEAQQDSIIGAAHRLGLLDRQEIAFLAGCPVAHVYQVIRGR